ncbi:GlxA family transcriptional regulator [Chryseolinea lacunae]|uniref:Helix-turn-helix domain-containing protein n=1 Tax=Chryseolinea lacunae TaxID=2801331 RepID=A0ABS1L2J7_9BACT|nr:helix-turn-helix domain-containing protein [Chryseolinea lacunae]MBL0745914.1 helix-turn-helix domain-containing protein [Chryseolinea lacunae]
MITISILALRNSVMASIADTRNVFSMVNAFLAQAQKPALFNIQLVGLGPEVTLNDGLFSIHPDLTLDRVTKTDLIIIPSLTGDMMSATHVNRDYAHWVAQQYKNGVEVASLCAGAFLLAFSGVLKGKQCTTHWLYANEFRHFYPSVKLVDEKVITDQNGLYSSGGCNAYWNLLLHLVEKYTNREMAIRTAKYFVIDLDRTIQSPFIIFHGLKDHHDDVILKAQAFVEQHYAEKLTVDEIADRFNLTRRTFERRFKKATRHTVVEYIQRVKIEAVKKQLEIGRKSITEVMLQVGYSDTQTFRDVFKRITGMTPVDYRKKYNA